MQNSKKCWVLFVEYALIFLCLIVAFFFVPPQSDTFLFFRQCDYNFSSILDYSLNYGNGRILGNFFGILFSHSFEYMFIFTAGCITLTVALLNHLIFKSSVYSPFALALLIVFPSSGVLGEVHTLASSFINFFTPITIALISLCIYKFLNEDKSKIITKIILNIILFLTGVFSCLFSENTAIVLFTTAFLLAAHTLYTERKIKFHQINYAVSVLLGLATTLLLPTILGTADKMDHYRQPKTSILSLISNAVASFVRFSDIFCSFILLVIIVSVALIITASKQKTNYKFKQFCVSFLAIFPIFCIIIESIGYHSNSLALIRFFEAAATFVYLLVFLYILFKIDNKKQRIAALGGYVILLSAIVPMLVVSPYGYRTNLTTYFILLFLSAFLLKNNVSLENSLPKVKQFFNKKTFAWLICAALILVSGYTTVQSLYNYNTHVVRSKYIMEEINNGSEEIKVPLLPFPVVSMEDEWPNIVSDIAAKAKNKIVITNSTDCENAKEYEQIISDSIFANLQFAFDNLEFRSSTFVEDTLN